MRYAVIMAGGAGTRLWPMSRSDQPKQLIPLFGGKSLLEIAADRLEGLIDPPQRLICTGEAYREPIRRSLPAFTDEQILGEPEGRDTLAAVGFPAAVLAHADPDAVMIVLTADHLISPVETFQERIREGLRLVESTESTLGTFGVRPTHPATGYGYVAMGDPVEGTDHTRGLHEFTEKPDPATAERYLASGDYLWNSGMFVWRARTLLECIRRYRPDAYEGLMKIGEAWATEKRDAVLREVYPSLPKTSVDYAVMEPASRDPSVRVVTVAMDVQWTDVGGWPSYGQTLTPDDQGNRTGTDHAILHETENTLVASEDPDHLVATIGVRDLVVVHTPHATLVCHREEAEKIKQLQKEVERRYGPPHT